MRQLLLVLILFLSACNTPTVMKKSVPPGTVGQPVQVGSLTLTVVRVARSQTTAGQTTPAGLPNLTIQIDVKNSGDIVQTIGPTAFGVEDDQKKVHAPKEPSPQPPFASKSIAKGESNAGLLAFEVPASQTLTLVFTSPQSDYEPVRVSLTS